MSPESTRLCAKDPAAVPAVVDKWRSQSSVGEAPVVGGKFDIVANSEKIYIYIKNFNKKNRNNTFSFSYTYAPIKTSMYYCYCKADDISSYEEIFLASQ